MAVAEEEKLLRDSSVISFSRLLDFVSRAQTLISELLLLSGRVPSEFRDRRYDAVLFELRYFDSADEFEAKIEGNAELEALEDHLREACSAFMQRFFLLINGIVLYYQELLDFLKDLQEGVHVHATLDKIMENENACQLLTESLTFFGCLLLLLEHFMGGTLREKLLVAHVRCDHCFDTPNLDYICSLCRMHSGSDHPVHPLTSTSVMIFIKKPVDLFARFPFPAQIVETLISYLRHVDLYNQLYHYPDPEHRTTGLGSQGGCLYVLLFFSPQIFHNSFVMREIVDRFFKDSWVVPVQMYFTVDLTDSWDEYEVAKVALHTCLSQAFVHDLSLHHYTKVKNLMFELSSLLSDSKLTKHYVLENSRSLLFLVRDCNVSLRWLLLHRCTSDQKLRDIIFSVGSSDQVEEDTLLLILLKISQLEFEVKYIFNELLERKGVLWQETRCCALDHIEQLTDYCGSRALMWKSRDGNLKEILEKWSSKIRSLDYTDARNASRKLKYVISAFREVEFIHQIEENLEVKRVVIGTRKYLQDMLQIVELDTKMLSTLLVITDAIYAWGYIESFIKRLWQKIETDSSIVLNLHSFFLKFRPLVDVPILRICQNHSEDIQYVKSYYSSEYVACISAMLQIVPIMLFRILNEEMAGMVQSTHVANRIERKDLEVSLKMGKQLVVANAVDRISILAKDLKKWLEKEMRMELSKRFRSKLHSFFLSSRAALEELETEVKTFSIYLRSQLSIMECFQDLIHIEGSRIWEEELTYILKHCVQEECNHLLRRRKKDLGVTHVQLNYLSRAETFMGNLLWQIIQLSNPSRSMYIEPMSGWFNADGQELLGLHFFDVLESCLGPVGIASLDSLVVFLLEEKLEHTLTVLNKLLDTRSLEELNGLDVALGPATSLPLLGLSSYKKMIEIVDTSWEQLVGNLACIGQLQLLRALNSQTLRSICKVEASLLSFAVEGMIDSLAVQSLKGDQVNMNTKMKESFLLELDKQQMLCGFSFPFQTSYITKDAPPFLGRCACVLTMSQLSCYVFDTRLGTLTSRLKSVVFDFSPLVIGLGTFLLQFHPKYMTQYVRYMGQYIRALADATLGTLNEPQKVSVDPTSEVLKSAFWLKYFCKHMKVPKDLLDSCLPPSLVSILQTRDI
ncbi:uncharacterized protein [Aristolochia californica]|uniref:uncharacterized protein isoform X2 n=1 Tax=Aristolochia californica TaxID=171875 RepID=UPI0035D58701